ncbi:MAG: S4 domain-containing protein [Terricaulis sp.]
MSDRQRVDIWLWRARLAKTRTAASQLVAAGNVRLMRGNQNRRLEKAATEIEIGDSLVFAALSELKAVRILALPARRGPPGEASTLYRELDADGLA